MQAIFTYLDPNKLNEAHLSEVDDRQPMDRQQVSSVYYKHAHLAYSMYAARCVTPQSSSRLVDNFRWKHHANRNQSCAYLNVYLGIIFDRKLLFEAHCESWFGMCHKIITDTITSDYDTFMGML